MSPVMEFVPWKTFRRIIERYQGDAGVRTLGCADVFRILAFAQLTWRESLRDIEVCLAANQAKLFHMGLQAPRARSTLADALNGRDWRIYHALAHRLIARARVVYADASSVLDLEATVYALDATTIDLCLSLFSWTPFRSTKGAIAYSAHGRQVAGREDLPPRAPRAPRAPRTPGAPPHRVSRELLLHHDQVDMRDPCHDLLQSAVLGEPLQGGLHLRVAYVLLLLVPRLVDHQIVPRPVARAAVAVAVRPRTDRMALHPGAMQQPGQGREFSEQPGALRRAVFRGWA